MGDLIDRQDAVNVLCDNCDHAQAICPHYPCKQYTKIEQLPSAQPTQPNTPNTLEALDCISRQDAVDIINGYEEQFNGYIGTPNDSEVYAYARGLLLSIERNISALPSVQSEIEERMSETEQNVPNDDFISRKRAIDALMEDFKRIPTNAIRAKTVIEQLPPAKPEIIRCKDCKYADPFGHCDYVNFWNAINDFCSRAERKENR